MAFFYPRVVLTAPHKLGDLNSSWDAIDAAVDPLLTLMRLFRDAAIEHTVPDVSGITEQLDYLYRDIDFNVVRNKQGVVTTNASDWDAERASDDDGAAEVYGATLPARFVCVGWAGPRGRSCGMMWRPLAV